jgi:sugar lactone lactonase YvrE
MELRLRWPKMRKWSAAGALLTLGLLGCRQPLPKPPSADRPLDASVERPKPKPDSGSTEPDSPPAPPVDAASDTAPDAGTADGPGDGSLPEMGDVAPADLPPMDLGPAPGNCGLGRPDLSMLTATSAMAVARDGTIYFAQAMGTDGFIGRLRPSGPPAMALSLRLVRIPNGSRLSGMAIDNSRNVLYVASASRGAVHRINLAVNPPTTSDLVIGVAPNDLAWNGGTDGNLYYSDQNDRRIYRLSLIGMRTPVTANPLTDVPAGLAFGPGGDLFVGSATAGPITRIALAAGVEQSRTRHGSYNGVADGLAFDGANRLYVTAYAATGDSQLVRLDAGGNSPMTIATGGQLSSLSFGQGGLDCRDLYVTARPGAMLRVPVDVPGAQ